MAPLSALTANLIVAWFRTTTTTTEFGAFFHPVAGLNNEALGRAGGEARIRSKFPWEAEWGILMKYYYTGVWQHSRRPCLFCLWRLLSRETHGWKRPLPVCFLQRRARMRFSRRRTAFAIISGSLRKWVANCEREQRPVRPLFRCLSS